MRLDVSDTSIDWMSEVELASNTDNILLIAEYIFLFFIQPGPEGIGQSMRGHQFKNMALLDKSLVSTILDLKVYEWYQLGSHAGEVVIEYLFIVGYFPGSC